MKCCEKCGSKLRDNSKFCPSCGNPIGSKYTDNISDDIGVNLHKNIEKKRSSALKIILICVLLALLFLGSAGAAYMKISSENKASATKTIEILNVDIDKYPEVTVSMKINNYENKLNEKDVTIKENDAFQKDLKLSDGENTNEYKITYKTSDESDTGEKNMKVACALDGDEVIAEYSYTPPEKKQTSNQKSNLDNTVSTYDSNEIKVKNALDSYEAAYVKMINSKNIDYIKGTIDLSGGLIGEFTTLIKNYSEQQITEDLLSDNIEGIKKISDSEYEVTVYEKYYISYGKDKKSSYEDFRSTYVAKSTNSVFKIYAVKNAVTISNKQTP
ncbi:zinc ribbon domain-containing protein [Clostridium sp. BL-8]|uniref:zinc ribbon domain-containing protein n=1 Tax=Clostridium sp. BL-8 TaxID=349938 RepID=UPI00098CAD41|nr:zinc ribbon domain-containing protein [Clostridium sp. BL-8]OOM79059.1 hypothetical protein CLOBL_18610 [Clostridium sp. BL-8]